MKNLPYTLIIFLIICLIAQPSEAGFLYHATKRAAAKKIAKSGFSKSFMNPRARFGAKAYVSARPSTALLERRGANSVVRFKTSNKFKKHIMDTRKMKIKELKKASGLKDMRGSVKKRVIGPKLGKRLGIKAEKNNSVILYRSAKKPHAINYAIPKGIYTNPKVFKSDVIMKVK